MYMFLVHLYQYLKTALIRMKVSLCVCDDFLSGFSSIFSFVCINFWYLKVFRLDNMVLACDVSARFNSYLRLSVVVLV